MDVEIVKSNGQKFRLSDYGVVQDFVVNSIDRSVTRESVDGRKGSVDYGTNIGDRSISVPMIFKARDLLDYAHLRDELFGILDDDEPFYIREMRRKEYLQYEFVDFGQSPTWSNGVENEYVNGKQYKVRLDSNISPEQWDDKPNGDITIEFVTNGLPFAESIYTTLELHDSGYSATAEKYGLVDNINQDYLKYVYEPNLIDTQLYEHPFEKGMISSTTGENATSERYVRSAYIEVLPGQRYVIQDKGINNQLDYWWVFEYDVDGKYIGSFDTNGDPNPKKLDFIARGNMIRIMPNPKAEEVISLSSVGSTILPVMTGPPMEQIIEVYNAGNVTIEPESMLLELNFAYVSTSRQFKINNLTTEESFVYKRIENRTNIKIQGLVVTRGLFNAFRLTNRKFISLAPGVNRIKITGGTFESLSINTKFYYK